jgi:hypothetical protein
MGFSAIPGRLEPGPDRIGAPSPQPTSRLSRTGPTADYCSWCSGPRSPMAATSTTAVSPSRCGLVGRGRRISADGASGARSRPLHRTGEGPAPVHRRPRQQARQLGAGAVDPKARVTPIALPRRLLSRSRSASIASALRVLRWAVNAASRFFHLLIGSTPTSLAVSTPVLPEATA